MTAEAYPDEKLLQLFESRRRARLTKAWGSYRPRQPIASDLSDCRRYQVMRVIAWEVREPPDAQGMSVIEQGRIMEGPMIQQLRTEGWEIVEDQIPITITRKVRGDVIPILTGRMDGKIRLGKELVPFDIKDTGEHVVQRIHGEEDLRHSLWTRKWERQMQVYMAGSDAERSVLLLGFRGDRNPVIVHRDQKRIDEILETCQWAVETIQLMWNQEIGHETVDSALTNGLEIDYHTDFNVCRSCPFRDKACYPPQPARQTAQYRPELADMTRRLIETKPAANEYNRFYNALKKETDGIKTTIAGSCVIEREEKKRNKKAKPATSATMETYWSFSAFRVDDREADESEEETA